MKDNDMNYIKNQKSEIVDDYADRRGKSIDRIVQTDPVDGLLVKFKKGTTEFLNDKEELLFSEFLDELAWAAEVSIHGYASVDCDTNVNFQLSHSRVVAIEKLILKRYPNMEIHRSACGELEGDIEDA